jgi:hypothetical protein
MNTSRRRFLHLAGGAAVGLGNLRGLLPFSPLQAAEAAVTPDLVQWRPEILPLVRLIESTSRDKCPEMLAGQLRQGVPFRELMAATFLHALRHDGHHTVYLVHSALEMSRDLLPEERLLPLFWAVDVVKEHIERFKEKPAPPLRGTLPSAENAAAEFDAAMDAWEQERAELAVIGLARSHGTEAAFQRFCHYAARDWSFIGHMPIAVSNAWRTLGVIGERHAEPTLRYLVRELHHWNSNRTRGQSADPNQELVKQWFAKLPPDWADPRSSEKGVLELLRILRLGDWNRASQWVARGLAEKWVHAGDVWDATHLATAEFMVRFKLGNLRMANRALHSNTSGNALHHLFKACEDARTRFFITLQAAAWAAAFLKNEGDRGMLRDLQITALPETEVPASADAAVEKIFSLLPPRPFREEIEDRSGQDEACRLALAFGRSEAHRAAFVATARRLVAAKATINSHDVKFPVAIFENLAWVNPPWRPHVLAASVHFLHGTQMPDSPVIESARLALAG